MFTNPLFIRLKMIQQSCFRFICFIPPDTTNNMTKIFGFSEFLASLALLVVIFTVSDFRYKFRISVAPIPLYGVTFFIISLTGFGSLLSDLWVGQKWWVIKSELEIRLMFQSFLGVLFLGCFIVWNYYAFINPPKFGKRNHERYLGVLYNIILKGNNNELAVAADELGNSAEIIIENSGKITDKKNTSSIKNAANNIILLLANRKFCKVIVSNSPLTAYLIFQAISKKDKYDIPAYQFSAIVSEEALLNKDSVIYHENDAYSSGLMGYTKQWSKAIYGDSVLIDNFEQYHLSPFSINYKAFYKFDSIQWEAYGRLICIYLDDLCLREEHLVHSHSFSSALSNYEHCTNNSYKLNENINDELRSELINRVSVATDLVRNIFSTVHKRNTNTSFIKNQAESKKDPYPKDISDSIAEMMLNIIFNATQIKVKDFTLWHVHHNIIWEGFFGCTSFYNNENRSVLYKKTKGKLIRLMYEEIKQIDGMPNYKNTRIAGYLLNVCGLKFGSTHSTRKYKDLTFLKDMTLKIVQRKYLSLANEMPEIADNMLVGGLSFDEVNNKLVKTYAKLLTKTANKDILDLDPPLTKTS